jgi:hypothetical protein
MVDSLKEGEADGRFKEKRYGAQHEDGSGKRKREERKRLEPGRN